MKKQQVVIAVLLASLSASAWGMRRVVSDKDLKLSASGAQSPTPRMRSLNRGADMSPVPMTDAPSEGLLRAPAKKTAQMHVVQMEEYKERAQAAAEVAHADNVSDADTTLEEARVQQRFFRVRPRPAVIKPKLELFPAQQARFDQLAAEKFSDLAVAKFIAADNPRTFAFTTGPRVSKLEDGRLIQRNSLVETDQLRTAGIERADNQINSVLRHKEVLENRVEAQKGACYRSAAYLGGVLLGCMYIYNKGILEYLAERHGPMSANIVQVVATLAAGAYANRMWNAGWNAWSVLPEKIKEIDERLIKLRRARSEKKILDAHGDYILVDDIPLMPQMPKSRKSRKREARRAASNARRAAAAAPAQNPEDQGSGLGLGGTAPVAVGSCDIRSQLAQHSPQSRARILAGADREFMRIFEEDGAVESFRRSRAAIAAAAPSTPAVTVEVGDLEPIEPVAAE